MCPKCIVKENIKVKYYSIEFKIIENEYEGLFVICR